MTASRNAWVMPLGWLWALALWLLCSGALAQGQSTQAFDHLRTGFALTGSHSGVRCESCHQNGVLKGTPRDCASCHTSGQRLARGNTVMPGNHVASSQGCDSCHGTKTFSGARFNHAGVTAGSCASCHNGVAAAGQGSNHLPYTSVPATAQASCDSCHKGGFGNWANGKLHSNFSVTTGCASCHSGTVQGAVGKPATPIHNGVTACENCHSSSGSTWSGAKVDHASFGASTNCSSCHNGNGATGLSGNHIPVGSSNCFSCHATSGWKPSKWNHTQLSVAGQCATCHTGGYPPADGRSAKHVPFASVAATASATCDSCHKSGYGAWTPAKVHANASISSGCFGCHTGAFPPAVGKPSNATHASVTGNCESCHKSTSTWSSAKVDHSSFNASTNCASCHNGSPTTGKKADHIPVGSTNCFSCHTVTGWTPTKWNHTQTPVGGQCASCHTGGYPPADGRSANHVPYTSVAGLSSANCDTCHKSGFGAWAPAKVHANAVITAGCSSCHTGAFPPAVGKPSNSTHASVTGNCESCHKSTSTWSSAKVDHSSFNASTNCASCHNGNPTTGKKADHIPVGSVNCISCHTVTGWTPTKWNHTQMQVAAQCATCHTGGYPPADGRIANHVPYASVAALSSASCDTCHKSGFGAWAPAKVHANASITTGCFSCHTGAFPPAVGKPSNSTHAAVTGNCESCHKSTSAWAGAKVDHSGFNASTNCASCHNGNPTTGKKTDHIPVGSTNCFSCHTVTGWTPTKWNHTQVTVSAQCATCHTGGYPPADGRSSNHVPYASVAGLSSANCDTCHKSGFGAWAPAKVHANASITTGCFSCHTGAFPPAVGKPSNSTHAAVSGNCESCHKSTSAWAGAKVDHSGFNAATNCASCHNGNPTTGKKADHIPVGSTNCFSCHTVTGWTPTKWNHTQLTVSAQCATCHTGGYPPADGRSSNHVPYASVAALSSANCDTCHKSGFGAWAPAKVHANASITTGCFSCHTGAFPPAVGKPSNSTHASVTGNCESCHKSTSAWAGAKVDHSSFNASTNCASCHNGNPTTGKKADHIPVGSTNCFSCHAVTGWTPTKWNHTQVQSAAQCATCHTGGYPPADGRSANHVPYASVAALSSANCDTCHKSGYSAWAPAKVHANASITTGCFSCHTGAFPPAVSKPSNSTHASVTGNCESCHKSTSAWAGAKVDHSAFNASTNCASCHNGNPTTGKKADHIPVGSTNCFSCHAVTGWTPTKWNHTQVQAAAQCATCHTGGYPPADGRSANHVPYASVAALSSANCDTCHKSGYSAWAPAKVHANASITTGCFSCHTGAFPPAVGKPSNSTHASVTGNCESCHKSTSAWAGAKVDHSAFNASTNCASCHNGNPTTGKKADHIPVGSTNCFSCHAVTGWTPTKWNHTQVQAAAQCATCHTGGYPPADGRSANHVPYASVAALSSANCDTCHKSGYSAWAPAKVHANASITTGCFSCHTGAFSPAVGKPSNSTHASVTGNCESCHKSTSSWSGAKVDHSAFNTATNCASCHNGNPTTGKKADHIPVGSTNCFSCHTVTGWTPTKWNHTQVQAAAQCATCHTGGYPPADGRSANHVPYASVAVLSSANCDTCHKSGYSAWAPAKVHANASITTGCFSCHTGAFPPAVGKPSNSTHASVTGNCESCHKSTSSWSGAKVDHSAFNAATNCASCHNGNPTVGKSATHVPVGSTNCFSCHTVTGWTPTKWNHTQVQVAAQCATCHTGGYPPADGRSSNHVPYASVAALSSANCDTCHKAGYSAWAPAKVHANASISTGCFSCHTGAFPPAVGKPSNSTHATVTGNCESCHKSTSTWSGAKVDHSGYNAATNCASCHNGNPTVGKSANHVPVGSTNCFSCHTVTGWTPTKWNHTQVTTTAQCATCHTGGYPPADGRPANHVPYQTVAVSASANCDACHKGSFASWANGKFHNSFSVSTGCFSCHTGGYLNAVGKPSNSTHATVAGNCESCHKSTTTWLGAKVDHSGFNAATNCASCHNGNPTIGKSANHIPVGATNCYACHTVTGWTPTKWNHTQVTTTAQCATCHTGGYPPADGRPANHVPYQTVAVSAAANCDACHKGSFTSWGNGKFHANYSVSTGCFSCHTGGYLNAVGKPSNTTHATVTGNCEGCHKTTTTWAGAKVDHSGFNATTNCASCHNGNPTIGKSANHIPVGATNCFNCHTVTGWTPTKWNHTQVTTTAQCATCHTGGYPPSDGKPGNHIPYQTVTVSAAANCDACHKGSFTSWANGKFHTYYTVSTGCFSCHTGGYLNATGKPNNTTHATVTGNCESCHNKGTSTWAGATYAHSAANAVGTGTCDTCHNGGSAKGKPANHIPIPGAVAKCDSCHKSQASFKTSVTMNHSVVTTGQCKSCHNGSYTSAGSQGALAKPASHIPEVQLLNGAAMDCNACHTSTSSWGSQKMNHNASQGNGAGWCKACHQSGTSFMGSMEKKSLTHEKSTGVTDCSQSGCHRPLGNKGSAYTKWD